MSRKRRRSTSWPAGLEIASKKNDRAMLAETHAAIINEFARSRAAQAQD